MFKLTALGSFIIKGKGLLSFVLTTFDQGDGDATSLITVIDSIYSRGQATFLDCV